MLSRRCCQVIALGLFCILLLGAPGELLAQPTAKELFTQGLERYEAGELEEARQILYRADPFQLSREDRLVYYRTLARIGRGEGPEQQPAPTELAEQQAAPETQTAPPQAQEAQPQPEPQRRPTAQTRVVADDIVETTAGVTNDDVVVEAVEEEAVTEQYVYEGEDAVEIDEQVEVVEATVDPADDLLSRNRRLHAQQRVQEAREAMDQGQNALAIRLLDQALAFDPDNPEIVELRDQAAGMAAGDAPMDPLDANIQARTLQSQQARAEFNSAMEDARRLSEQEQFDLASERAAAARQILDRSREQLPQEEYRQLRSEAQQLAQQILTAQQIADEQRAQEARAQQEADAEQARRRELMREQEEVNNLLRRAMTMKTERRYEEALELAEQVLFLDPNNIAGQLIKTTVENDAIYHETAQAIRARNLSFAQDSLESYEATTLQQEIVKYPPDWPELTQRRLAGMDVTGGESEINRRVSLRMQEPISVEFERNELASVVTFMRNFTGLNFFVNWRALEEAGVSEDTPVSLTLRNVSAEQALELVLSQVSSSDFEPVTYSIIRGVVHISTRRDLQRTTEIRTYDIRDLLVQVPNFTDAPRFDLSSALEDSLDGGGGAGAGIFGDVQDTDLEAEQEQLLIDIQELIMDSIGDPLEWADRGGDVSSLRELNGNLIVRTTPQNHRRIVQLLAQLRETRAVQISVEARFLLVGQDFLEEVGVDLDINISNFGGDHQFDDINISSGSAELARRATTDLTPSRFTGGADALDGMSFGINYSYLDDLQVSLLVRATQASRESITLTAPRVTFFNGQRAYVLVARQIAFVSDLEPIPDAAGFDPTLGVVQSGVVLDVQGTISSDRRYVTMTMRPSLATLAQIPIRTIPIVGSTTIGGGGDGGGSSTVDTFSGELEAPELELTMVRSTVSVPDKGTIMLGGQKLVQEVEYEAGVPVLSKIPVINRFFTNTSTVKDERTLLILTKPTIIIQSELEEQMFPGMESDPTSFNLGGFN